MKIIILHRNSFDLIGGAESTIYYMVDTLKKKGHTPVVLAKDRNGVSDNNDVCKVLRYTRSNIKCKLLLPIEPLIEYWNAKNKIKKIIETENPDYIITRDNILAVAVSCFFDNQRVVYIPLVVNQYYSGSIRKFHSVRTFLIECIRWVKMRQESYFQKIAFRKLPKVIVFSKNMKTQIAKALGYEKEVSIIPPGVSPKFYIDANTDEGAIRQEFNIEKNKKLLLFVGRVVQEKNVRMLIDAYAKSENQNTMLIIVGGGDDLECVKNMAERLKVSDKVIFAGFRKDTEKFYRDADLFVLPSYYESFGNVILESLAAGVPVVGFRTEEGKTLTAIDELIEDGKSGFVCKEYATQALVDAINRAVEKMDTSDYKNIKKYCADTAKTRFTWNRFMKQVLEVLMAND